MRFVPVQSGEGADALKAVGLDALDPASFLVVKDGRSLQKSTAVKAVLDIVGGSWKLPALLLGLLPRSIATKSMTGSPRIDTSGLASARRVLSRAKAVSAISCRFGATENRGQAWYCNDCSDRTCSSDPGTAPLGHSNRTVAYFGWSCCCPNSSAACPDHRTNNCPIGRNVFPGECPCRGRGE